MSPRLLVVCIDGATPDGVRAHGLARHGDWSPLTSIYPSSTAPAHASMLTGEAPSVHGVVGNRFWTADTDGVIARAAGDPIATLHPYERDALACPSLLDTLERAGRSYAALMFPHTFSHRREIAAPAAYTLYAPTEDRSFTGDGELGAWPIRVFDEPASLALALDGDTLHARCGDPRVAIHRRGAGELDVVCLDARRALSFALALHHRDGARVVIRRKTATLVACFGGATAASLVETSLPHSSVLDYDADPGSTFYECPRIEWTTEAALALLAGEPDVLFVRYNQVDHAQEHLYGLAHRGDARARAQLAAAYARVDAGLIALRARVGLDCPTIMFSDHGIDTVDVHIHLNALLAELGVADRFVFQGDSSCAYLYPDRPDDALSPAMRAAIERAVAAHPALWIAGADELAALGCRFPARQGVLAVRCQPHVELQYGAGPVQRTVRSASHGFSPHAPAMHGVFLPINLRSGSPRPASITELRALLESLLT